jgi:glycerophosphoryl diester phosphodiesterase
MNWLIPSILSILLVMMTACSVSPAAPATPAAAASPTAPAATVKKTLYIVGHRGAAGLAPENTLAAFQKGLDLGVDAVELDVHLSKDGELVVIHDPKLDRTTDGTGNVAAMTLAELKKYNAAANFKGSGYGVQRIPTLQEVFSLVGKKAHIHIEIKLDAEKNRYPGIEEKVLAVVQSNQALERTTISSFDFETVRTVAKLEPKIDRRLIVSTDYFRQMGLKGKGPADIAADLQAQGGKVVDVDKTYLSDYIITAIKNAGMDIAGWTVNDPEQMKKLAALGITMFTSDRPDLLLAAR